MKAKTILLASVLLLAVMTLGAVSATDELVADNDDSLSMTNEIGLEETADDAALGEGEKEDWNMEIVINNNEGIITGDEAHAYTEDGVMWDNDFKTSDFNLTIDEKHHDFIYDTDNCRLAFNTTDLATGKHNYTIAFLGTEKINPTSSSGTFEIVPFIISIPENCVYGQPTPLITLVTPLSYAGYIADVTVDGYEYDATISDKEYYGHGYATFNYDDMHLRYGLHELIMTLDGEIIANKTVNVDYELNVGNYQTEYGYDETVLFADIDGIDVSDIIVKIDGKAYEYEIDYTDNYKNVRIHTTPELIPGIHNITVDYPANEMFPAKTFNGTLEVIPTLHVNTTVITSEDGFWLLMPDDAKGNLTIVIKKEGEPNTKYKQYANVKAAGAVFIPIENLEYSVYEFDYRYDADDYNITSDGNSFTVNPKIILPPAEINQGEKAFVVINITGANGTAAVRLRAKEGQGTGVELVNGSATIEVPYLASGENHYFVELTIGNFDGEGYFDGTTYYYNFDVTVRPNITMPSGKILMGDGASVTADLIGVNGTLTVLEFVKEGEGYSAELVNGKATVPVIEKLGKHTFYAYLELNSTDEWNVTYDHGVFVYYFDLEVVNPITAKDTTALYSANSKYSVQIKDANGKAVSSGKVTFTILDGKKQILKKTVNIKSGTATLEYKITQGAKTYSIKTDYKKASITKKLTVKHAVTLKSATVKKSAKKLTLQATLSKVNGKYLKNKQVTFKFNGKTYKAKTSSKGIAKVTVAKSVLSKLKVGKKVTYQATYLKDTVKKTATVKK